MWSSIDDKRQYLEPSMGTFYVLQNRDFHQSQKLMIAVTKPFGKKPTSISVKEPETSKILGRIQGSVFFDV